MIFTPDHTAMYVAVPKTGCSTIKMVVAASVGLVDHQSLEGVTRGNIHRKWKSREGKWSDLTEPEREALLTSDSTLRFTSVRNPYERIVSCYLDKIVGHARSYYLARKVHERGEVSLLEFLEFVSNEPPLMRDVHCRAMTDLCFSGCVAYDVIIRYESFESDVRKIMVRLNVPTRSIPATRAKLRTDAGSRMHALLGPKECGLIREIYRLDFEEFGYSLDLP